MVNKKIICLSFLLAITLFNCTSTNNTLNQSGTNSADSKTNALTITGVVQFPKKFSTKATQTNVASKATVSLIYPPDYPVETLRNVTITGGYTDASGRFTLSANHSFIPQTDDVLILEATKRIGGAGNNSLSLRTLMKWNGNTFQSITTPGIYVNSKTTGLSIISSFDNSFEDISTIGSMTISNNGITNFTDINENVTAELIDSVKGLVEEALDKNLDPVAVIDFQNNKYFINSNGLNNVLFEGCAGETYTCLGLPVPTPTPTAIPTPEPTPSASPEPTPTPCGGYGNPCSTPTPTASPTEEPTPVPPTIVNLSSFTYSNTEPTFVSDADGNGIMVDSTVVNTESGELQSIATADTVLDLTGKSAASLTFTNIGSQVADTANLRKLEYSIDGINWVVLASYNQPNFNPDTVTVDLAPVLDNAELHLRFNSIISAQDQIPDEGNHYWDIKDISVSITD